jgi:hypothetical protein
MRWVENLLTKKFQVRTVAEDQQLMIFKLGVVRATMTLYEKVA